MSLDNYRFPIRLGGDLCLNFANTVEYHDTDHRIDFLPTPEHALAWCWRTGQIGTDESDRLQAEMILRPKEANEVFQTALDLRETIYRIFTAIIDDRQPSADDIASLNTTLAATQRRIEPNAQGFQWTWAKGDDFRRILAPIALAAAELLTSDQLQWVSQCPNCGWLFVDTSRNHTRRWCSMDFCGSKIKSRRQYERRKQSQA